MSIESNTSNLRAPAERNVDSQNSSPYPKAVGSNLRNYSTVAKKEIKKAAFLLIIFSTPTISTLEVPNRFSCAGMFIRTDKTDPQGGT